MRRPITRFDWSVVLRSFALEKMFSLLDGAARSYDIAIVPCLPLAYDKQFDGSPSHGANWCSAASWFLPQHFW
jgi:hypothetical protein